MPRLPLPPIAPFLYLEEMHGLIEEKKLRRENLNIFVLSAEEYGINSDNSELIRRDKERTKFAVEEPAIGVR